MEKTDDNKTKVKKDEIKVIKSKDWKNKAAPKQIVPEVSQEKFIQISSDWKLISDNKKQKQNKHTVVQSTVIDSNVQKDDDFVLDFGDSQPAPTSTKPPTTNPIPKPSSFTAKSSSATPKVNLKRATKQAQKQPKIDPKPTNSNQNPDKNPNPKASSQRSEFLERKKEKRREKKRRRRQSKHLICCLCLFRILNFNLEAKMNLIKANMTHDQKVDKYIEHFEVDKQKANEYVKMTELVQQYRKKHNKT